MLADNKRYSLLIKTVNCTDKVLQHLVRITKTSPAFQIQIVVYLQNSTALNYTEANAIKLYASVMHTWVRLG
jgi:hypothetical protein